MLDYEGNLRAVRLFAVSLLAVFLAPAAIPAHAEDLKLLVSVEQPSITAPFSARVTLNLHNAGQQTLWLYRRVSPSRSEGSQPIEGPTLDAHLEPAEGGVGVVRTHAEGGVFESVGLPHPQLVRLGAGQDYEEKTVIHLVPAELESPREPVWGRYRLSVTYRAKFSNAEQINRNLEVDIWQGEVTSNTIEIELRPPTAEARGAVSGTVSSADGRLVREAVVSLSDQSERLLDQVATDPNGRFSFGHLQLGIYWVTVRRKDSSTDSVVFHHAELTPAAQEATTDFVILDREAYQAKQVLHKPVLFRITDSAGKPFDKVTLELTFSNGTVLDNVKGEVQEDGAAALELIPGRNYLTLHRRGCPRQDERVDVAEGGGIDGFKLALDCSKR
jgi:hypothetical protein